VTVPSRGRDLLQCNDERAGVMLLSWNWSVNLVLPLPTFSTIRGIDELNSIAVASFRKIPVLSASVR
jgi:hypothetical protein